MVNMKDTQPRAVEAAPGRSEPTGGCFQGGTHMVCCLMDTGCEGRQAVGDYANFCFIWWMGIIIKKDYSEKE